MMLNEKSYKLLKWVAQFFLPASGTLYFALSSIWGLPYGEQIIGSITAFNIFLGVILGISTHEYNKTVDAQSDGQLLIDSSDPNRDIYRLDLGANLEILGEKRTVTLSVKPNQNLSGDGNK